MLWEGTPVHTNPGDVRRVTLASAILAVCILLPFMFIDGQLPKVLHYFTADLGEFDKIALRREGGGSGFYLYNLLLANLLPFVGFCLLALAFAPKPAIKVWTIIFIGLIAVGKAATLSKAPLALFILQCAIVWLMLRKLTLPLRDVFILAGLATCLFLLMSWVANPRLDDLLSIFDFLFYRVFMIVNEGLLEYFAAIPYVIPHSWGAKFSWIATLLQSGEPRLATYWLVGEVHRGVLGSTTTVMFMGDAWAEFAWFGVAFTAFLAGAVARWIDIQLIVKRGKTMASVAGLALGHFGVFIAMSTSFQTSLITGGLLFVVPFVRLISMRWRARPQLSPIDAARSAHPDSSVPSL
jgi:oligosaccharide repeat unit polymerase